MKTELLVKFEFVASHSLMGYETPHPHRWRLEIVLQGEPIHGKVVDMIALREKVLEMIRPLELTYLNDNALAGAEVQAVPTCETLSIYFVNGVQTILVNQFQLENSTLTLSSVLVAICEMDGIETGAVRRIL